MVNPRNTNLQRGHGKFSPNLTSFSDDDVRREFGEVYKLIEDSLNEVEKTAQEVTEIELTPGPEGPIGPQGPQGPQGDPGQGVPIAGTTGQALVKIDATDFNTTWADRVAPARQVLSGTGLTGGGDLSADRTLAADFGALAGKVTEGNDARLSDARTPTAHAASHQAGGSDVIRRTVIIKVIADATALATGDGQASFVVPAELHGMNLVTVGAHVFTASTSGLPTIQLRRSRGAVDMLSTRITIDANEVDSVTAATPAVIDAANDDVQEGDVIFVDVDVAGTGTAGLEVRMGFGA